MIKRNVKTIEDVEIYFSKVRKIKFKEDVIIDSLDDIFRNLFGLGLRGMLQGEQKSTFYRENQVHCETQNNYKYRSFDDFFKLSKNYFPEITIQESITHLLNVEKEKNKDGVYLSIGYCGNIRKSNLRSLCRYGRSSCFADYNIADLFPKLDLQMKNI
jgi:hypothetical protein